MISERIKEARARKGVSMRQAAIDMNFPYTTYVNYEKGFSEPNSENLVKIAVYYNVSADYLLGRSEEKTIIDHKSDTEDITETFTEHERRIISAYRQLDGPHKKFIENAATFFKDLF